MPRSFYLVIFLCCASSIDAGAAYDRGGAFRPKSMRRHPGVSWPVPMVPLRRSGGGSAAFVAVPKGAAAAAKMIERESGGVQGAPPVMQFQSQDNNGQVVFGFNAPDQMRIETRNADGTVHGTYSYIDPYGRLVKRQYWDTGSGFHITSNDYPIEDIKPSISSGENNNFNVGVGTGGNGGSGGSDDANINNNNEGNVNNNGGHDEESDNVVVGSEDRTNDPNEGNNDSASAQQEERLKFVPEVAAGEDSRKINFKLYQQALSSMLSSAKKSNPTSTTLESIPSYETTTTAEVSSTSSSPSAAMAVTTRKTPDDAEDNFVDERYDGENKNGTILIERPKYLRISWTTDNKYEKGGARLPVSSVFATTLSDTPYPRSKRSTLSVRK